MEKEADIHYPARVQIEEEIMNRELVIKRYARMTASKFQREIKSFVEGNMIRNEDPNYTCRMPEHTPTPWKIDGCIIETPFGLYVIHRLHTNVVANEDMYKTIVRAVNSHEALLRAAKKALIYVNEHDDLPEGLEPTVAALLRRAISKAEKPHE